MEASSIGEESMRSGMTFRKVKVIIHDWHGKYKIVGGVYLVDGLYARILYNTQFP